MAKMTATEFRKNRKFKTNHTVAYYDGTEAWNQKPVVVSDEVTEPTTVHRNGSARVATLIVPSDLTRPDVQNALMSWAGVAGESAWATVRDIFTREVVAKVRMQTV